MLLPPRHAIFAARVEAAAADITLLSPDAERRGYYFRDTPIDAADATPIIISLLAS